jgi:hypothetical protein
MIWVVQNFFIFSRKIWRFMLFVQNFLKENPAA